MKLSKFVSLFHKMHGYQCSAKKYPDIHKRLGNLTKIRLINLFSLAELWGVLRAQAVSCWRRECERARQAPP